MPDIVRQLREIRQQHGTRAALEWLVDRIGRRLVRLEVSDVVWLDVERINPSLQADAAFEFRFLTAAEVATWEHDTVYQLDDAMAERADRGLDLCFAALCDGQLAAYGWYALDSLEPEHCAGVGTSQPPHVAHMYKGFTHPDYRGRRLHGLVMSLALRQLHAERGITHLASLVDWTNWASLKSCYRLGYESLGRMVAMRPLGIKLVLTPRAARQRGVIFGRRADLSSRQAVAEKLVASG